MLTSEEVISETAADFTQWRRRWEFSWT